MERFMYNDETFEGTLKGKADEYRMYPSQQTWESIQKQIKHRNRTFNFKSFGLSTLLLLGFAITVGDDELTNSERTSLSLQQPLTNTNENDLPETTKAPVVSIRTAIEKKLIATTTVEADNDVNVHMPDESSYIQKEPVTPAELTEATGGGELTAIPLSIEKISADNRLMSVDPAQRFVPTNATATPEMSITPTAVIEDPQSTVSEPSTFLTDAELNYEVDVPVISKQPLKKQIQFYLASSASYRVLYNDHQLMFGNLQTQDPENVVRHKPSLGFETGTALLFPISKNVKFRTGLQLNYTRYNVDVFRSNPQVATIAFATSGVVQRMSVLRTDSGRLSNVKNESLQISIPVGFEWKLAGKRKVRWNMAANIQPTYLISASGYVLTNDLKRYVKAPDLLSNLNLNSALETFLRWDMNDFQLQAGPQLRYQLLTNTRGDYQIKEHLVDYGFRIGLVKTLR